MIKPQYLPQTFALMAVATRSVNVELQPSKIQVWRASCQDPISAELQDKVRLILSCLGRHLQIHGDIEPSPVVLGEQASMEKTTQRLQRIATTLADLNAEGLNAQSVNDLLTTYVGAASQHVLRMSFCVRTRSLKLRQAGHDVFGPTSFNATSPLRCFFCPSNLEEGLCSSAACCRSMACLAVDHSHINGKNPVTRHRHSFQCSTTTQIPNRTTPNHPFNTNEQTSFPTQTTWRSPSP